MRIKYIFSVFGAVDTYSPISDCLTSPYGDISLKHWKTGAYLIGKELSKYEEKT